MQFIGYLRMLTLSSVHPMLGGQPSTPGELVDVLLEGALDRAAVPTAAISPATVSPAAIPPATSRKKT